MTDRWIPAIAVNPHPTVAQLINYINKCLDDDGELDGSREIIRQARTAGYDIALRQILEVIDDHERGIRHINDQEM